MVVYKLKLVHANRAKCFGIRPFMMLLIKVSHLHQRYTNGPIINFSPQQGAQQSFVLRFCLWLELSVVSGQVYIC